LQVKFHHLVPFPPCTECRENPILGGGGAWPHSQLHFSGKLDRDPYLEMKGLQCRNVSGFVNVFCVVTLKQLFENVEYRNVVAFIKRTNFCRSI